MDETVDVKGKCPACGSEDLFVGAGGYVTCSRLECSDPVSASDVLRYSNKIYRVMKILKTS